MKKIVCGLLLFFTITVLAPLFPHANAGPLYWEGRPATDAFMVDTNSPIVVEKEQLTFDFSHSENFIYAGEGIVQASYELFNPTAETINVSAIFPIVESLYSYSPNDTIITVDEREIPYEIILGRALPYENKKDLFDFETIINDLNVQYEPKHFSEEQSAVLHTIHIAPKTNEHEDFSITFSFNPEQTKVFTKGFNGYAQTNGTITLSAFIHEPTELQILVLGDDFPLETNEKITSAHITIKDYLYKLINENNNSTFINHFSANELYNLFKKEIDKKFNDQLGYASFDALLEIAHYDRIIAFYYNIPFEPESRKTLTVQYKTVGSYDQRNTPTPLYTFDYLLNPAKNWSDFNDLTITIKTPADAPHIIESTIDFIKKDEQMYTTNLKKLPDIDLTFTLYKNDKVTFVDKVVKNVTSPLFLIFASGALMIGLFIVLISIIVITFKKNKF